MAVYMIAEIKVIDREMYMQYVEQVPVLIKKHGGKYVCRGGNAANLIGDWEPNRVIVVEFPKAENLHSWFNSEEYQAIKHLRENSTVSRGIIVEGYNDD